MFRVEEILIVQGILAYGDDGNQYIIPSGASNQPFQVRKKLDTKFVINKYRVNFFNEDIAPEKLLKS